MDNQSAIPDFLAELRRHVDGEVRDDTVSRTLYSTDASIYQVQPYGVLIPRTIADVHAAVELANKYRLPILPRAAGSSLAGQAVNEALVIDMTRHLDQVLEVNREEQWVRVQPGLVLDELNLHLRPHGLQFGPDPASSNRAAMGGIVSNNSTGSHSIMYGMTADHVLGMEAFLSDGSGVRFEALEAAQVAQKAALSGFEGEIYRGVGRLLTDEENQAIIRRGTPRHWRRCGGYNLDRLFDGGASFRWPFDSRLNLAKLICGAEGTLAVISEITLNLVPLPTKTALAIVHFDDLFTALSAVPAILEMEPSAVELLDNLGLTMCREVPEYARLLTRFIEGAPNSVLITEFYGESDAELAARLERLNRHLAAQNVGATTVVPVLDRATQADVWTVRKVGLGLLMSIRGDHKPIPFIEDAAVPSEHLAEYVTRIEQFCHSLGTRVAYYAHASAGCVHIRPLINTKVAGDVAKLPQITRFSAELLGEYGGAMSSEHGDGRARSWINPFFFGPELYGLYRQVKQTFDPHSLLNPGNVVEAGPMTENLRFGASYQVLPLREHLDFAPDLGFHRAVEMCNGAGICRKTTAGTMCPSFMVTREEEHSTRGRANMLRAAMSGRLPAEALTSPRMYETMELCISCKACKAECPSSVDMAKIKTEFLAHYYEAHGKPPRVRLFGRIATLSRLSSGPQAALANRVLGSEPVRRAMERLLGISSRRTLPAFATQPFTTWFRRHRPVTRPHRKVVLFNDTFNTYNYPEVSIAATELLEAAGFEVILPGHRCCGRPALSKGLVDEARSMARQTVGKLAPYARQGIPIVGLEPSCLLTLGDEYFDLLPRDDADLRAVADAAIMLEPFIAGLAAQGTLGLTFTRQAGDVLLHGHCHQKALVGTTPSHAALGLPANYRVSEVDSGCCGMAGSFGYEAEHYTTSLAMGERRLLPAVRAAGAATIIAAAGVSCREQIRHATGRSALHPAQVLRNALVDEEVAP